MTENPPSGDRIHDLRSSIYEQYKTYALDHSASAEYQELKAVHTFPDMKDVLLSLKAVLKKCFKRIPSNRPTVEDILTVIFEMTDAFFVRIVYGRLGREEILHPKAEAFQEIHHQKILGGAGDVECH